MTEKPAEDYTVLLNLRIHKTTRSRCEPALL